ncbi:branched-chain amino acid ABC transporter permease [bacterium]|nr:branched-chain amino acid ABC transporter permease [bacterium]
MEYYIHLGILCSIYLILAASYNISFGLARMLNLAHIAFWALGAYGTALLAVNYNLGPLPCMIVSMILPAILSLLVGAISLRLSGDYFAIGTLAFHSIVAALLINWKSLTRGVLGIPGIPRPELFGINFYENINFLYLALVFVFLSLTIVYFVFKSPLALTLRALGENESAALALGKNAKHARIICFVISSIFAGIAGSLYAYYINYIDPSSFSSSEMIFILSAVIIGKPGSFWGALFGVIFLTLLPEPIRQFEIDSSILGPMRQLIYAAVLFMVVLLRRDSLFPKLRTV